MTKKRQSLKLPIFLMVAPIAGVVLSIFLYAIVNFIFSGVSTSSIPASDISIAQGAGENSDPYGETPMFNTIANIILFLLGVVSVLAIVPCLVVGIIIILNRQHSPQIHDTPEAKSKDSRGWGDLE